MKLPLEDLRKELELLEQKIELMNNGMFKACLISKRDKLKEKIEPYNEKQSNINSIDISNYRINREELKSNKNDNTKFNTRYYHIDGICRECKKVYPYKELIVHMQNVHQYEKSKMFEVICPFCDEIIPSLNFIFHCKHNHQNSIKERSTPLMPTGRYLIFGYRENFDSRTCSRCGGFGMGQFMHVESGKCFQCGRLP